MVLISYIKQYFYLRFKFGTKQLDVATEYVIVVLFGNSYAIKDKCFCVITVLDELS